MGSEFGVTPATKPHARLDAVGLFFIALASGWTLILVCAMVFLYLKREMPFLRIRGLPLSFAGIAFLHLYWCSVQIGYAIGPLAPPYAEYFIMGLWLPIGIGLFQASNSQLLHVAKMQKVYIRRGSIDEDSIRNRKLSRWSIIRKFQLADYAKKMFVYVTIGVIFQIFLTFFMYLISRKYHPSFGIPGTQPKGTPMEQKVEEGRGWEWWPTCFWQLFWAWIIAPIILWRARDIHDTHGWRVQTIGCCIAGLPASPMWLIALYVPGMAPVNNYWIPPQWIAISIMALEIFTIVLPCWQVMRHQTLQKETLEAIKLWEEKSKIGSINDTDYSGSTKISKSAWESFKAMSAFESGRPSLDHPESIFTMAALERALKLNAEPLRHFAALRDFSGENINFLTDLAAWKSQWSTEEGKKSMQVDETVHRKLYNRAIHIYANLVSPLYAEFPINISSPELKALEDVFEHAARILYGERSSFSSGSEVTPFDERWGHTDSKEFIMSPTSTTFAKADSEREISVADETPINFISDKVQYWGDIPADFNRNVFNRAEKSIKYLVLTNTWPKFVRSGGDETESGRSSLDRVSKYFRNMW